MQMIPFCATGPTLRFILKDMSILGTCMGGIENRKRDINTSVALQDISSSPFE